MKQLLLAFQFLTIVPLRINNSVNESDIARSASFFVIVGIAQGILLITVDYFSVMMFPPDLVSATILLAYVMSNGGFHIDGLADTFDAIAVKSGGNVSDDIQKRLDVMKDSTTGPIGITAVIFDLGLKYLALRHIATLPSFTYYSSLLLMPVMSKWTMVISFLKGKPARKNGLGNIFIKRIGVTEVFVSSVLLLGLLIIPAIFFRQYMSHMQYLSYLLILVAMYFFCTLWIKFSNRKFGGLTGDTLGAISETSEILFLFMVIVWSRLYT